MALRDPSSLSEYLVPSMRNSLSALLSSERYLPDPRVLTAWKAAALLGQPLLLEGPPGTGKTSFAHWLSYTLHKEGKRDSLGDRALVFHSKSGCVASDLFYLYDALGRLRDAQAPNDTDGRLPSHAPDYIVWQALGIATIASCGTEGLCGLKGTDGHYPEGVVIPKRPSLAVVLIDDIDQAPTSFIGDILTEIELGYFAIPECGGIHVKANDDFRPVIVFTCSSTRGLPESFLRRCVYCPMELPNEGRLKEIVGKRLGTLSAEMTEVISSALEVHFSLLQPGTGLTRPPSTAEILLSLVLIQRIWSMEYPDEAVVDNVVDALVKHNEDRIIVQKLVEDWVDRARK